jgi:hypothetical protein
MKQIDPISEENCREHYGKPVLVILKDGSELVGVLSRYNQDKIVLNSEAPLETTVQRSKKLSIKKKGSKKAKLSAYPPPVDSYSPNAYPNYYPYGGELVLDLALIALLFLLI